MLFSQSFFSFTKNQLLFHNIHLDSNKSPLYNNKFMLLGTKRKFNILNINYSFYVLKKSSSFLYKTSYFRQYPLFFCRYIENHMNLFNDLNCSYLFGSWKAGLITRYNVMSKVRISNFKNFSNFLPSIVIVFFSDDFNWALMECVNSGIPSSLFCNSVMPYNRSTYPIVGDSHSIISREFYYFLCLNILKKSSLNESLNLFNYIR